MSYIAVLRAPANRRIRNCMFRRCRANQFLITYPLLALSCALVALGQIPIPAASEMRVGIRETAKHRPPLPPVRCLNYGGYETVFVWLSVDAQGRVVSAQPDDKISSCARELQRVALGIHYVPFVQNGKAAAARVQDRFTLISAEVKPARVVPFPSVTDPSRVSVQLLRSGCFGSCPAYTVTIKGDGSVAYRGNGNVSIFGEHVSRIDTAKVNALLDRFRTANFFGLRDRYSASITDVPKYEISVRVGDRVKTIEDRVGERAGMPTVVTELEEAVDATADSARWVTSSPNTLEAMKIAGIGPKSRQAALILRAAVSVGDVSTARSLLAGGTPVSVSEAAAARPVLGFEPPLTQSLLELAVESAGDRLAMLNAILTSGRVTGDHRGLQQALANAVESGDSDLAAALISAGADPSARFGDRYDKLKLDRNYLMLAAASGVWAMIDDALSRPHDLREADSEGRTALVHFVYNAPQVEDVFHLVDRFLAAGADRADLDKLLLGTCRPNWIPGFIARGGNINARGPGGNTPLFQPCTVEGVQALLDAGADPTLRNDEGMTAVEYIFKPTNGQEDSRAAVIRRFMESRTRPSRR